MVALDGGGFPLRCTLNSEHWTLNRAGSPSPAHHINYNNDVDDLDDDGCRDGWQLSCLVSGELHVSYQTNLCYHHPHLIVV